MLKPIKPKHIRPGNLKKYTFVDSHQALENQREKIFIACCSINQEPVRNQLASVMESAGMEVLPTRNFSTNSDNQVISSAIWQSACSVIILYPEFAPMVDATTSLTQFQLNEAKKQQTFNPDHKIVIWLPSGTNLMNTEAAQLIFITELRNAIGKNMIFSNAPSAIHLTDDIRSMLEKPKEVVFEVSQTDVFMVSNEIDDSEAEEILDLLRDILPVESLTIVQDSDTDYSELCRQQISKSKLAVVYFKESSDWALPFTQQVWQKIGGAGSRTPILLIGDEDPETNRDKKIKAPRLISLIVSGELIPLEIKVQYDKVSEAG